MSLGPFVSETEAGMAAIRAGRDAVTEFTGGVWRVHQRRERPVPCASPGCRLSSMRHDALCPTHEPETP